MAFMPIQPSLDRIGALVDAGLGPNLRQDDVLLF
jgi:hypothetical protein